MTQQEKYNQRSKNNIAALRSDFGVRVQQWLDECRRQGLNPLIYMSARTVSVQQHLRDLYEAGKGPLAATPQKSYHCYARAVDWVNIKAANGKDSDLDWKNRAAYKKGILIAEGFKLHSIGDIDLPHLQDSNFASWRDLPQAEWLNT